MYLQCVLRYNLQFTLKFLWFFEEGKKSPSIYKGILGAEVSLQGARLCRRRVCWLLTGFWSWLVLHESLKHHSWVSCSSASLRASGFPAGCLIRGVWQYAPEAASPPQMVMCSSIARLLCWMQTMHHLLCIGTTNRKIFQSEVTSVAEGQAFRLHRWCEGQDHVVWA